MLSLYGGWRGGEGRGPFQTTPRGGVDRRSDNATSVDLETHIRR